MKEEIKNDKKEEKIDDNTKKLLLAVGIIIGVFALGFLVRFVYSPENEITTIDEMHKRNIESGGEGINYIHNGFSFIYMDDMWYTQVQRHSDNTLMDIPLHFGPKDLENVSISGEVSDDFKKSQIYITFDPTDEKLNYVALAAAELSLNLAKGMGIYPIAACTKNETETCNTRPIVDCDDEDKAVIFLKQIEGTGEVILDDNCVELKGKDWELVKATDRFLLQWYQVMK
ncbi:hypothetical protein GF361_00385 [Candidatus Woesearchaeota archaeon]|nr:hypothetical protein [Candidatus Woesearchaeota archaeon]